MTEIPDSTPPPSPAVIARAQAELLHALARLIAKNWRERVANAETQARQADSSSKSDKNVQ